MTLFNRETFRSYLKEKDFSPGVLHGLVDTLYLGYRSKRCANVPGVCPYCIRGNTRRASKRILCNIIRIVRA